MEEKSLGTGAFSEHAPPLDGPHAERRRRAHEVLAAQGSYLERLEQTLNEQLERLAAEMAQSAARFEAASGEGESAAVAALQEQFEALKQQFEQIDAENEQLRQQLEQNQVEFARTEQELRVRETLLKETQGHDEQRRVELATVREQLADVQAQLNAARNRQQSLEQEMEAERERFDAAQEETKAQRRRIAREFKQLRAEHLAELEDRKAELERLSQRDQSDLQAQLTELQAELESTRQRHAAEIESLQSSGGGSGGGADPQQLRELRDECTLLERKLEAAEARLAQRDSSDGDSDHDCDLQRRFEMAVEEVRELKRANAELESKLKNRGGSAAAAPASAAGGGLNWEAQKQRLLASLEADDGSVDDDEDAREERASIQNTIQLTDRVVAQKDEEIAELRRQLEQFEASGGSDSSAIQELLDADEIIRQEREKLTALQQEWRQKIGEAEIEISVQRAKLARERAELEEKIRQFQQEQDSRPGGGSDQPADAGKPLRGKWLARLGLKDLDENK